DFGEDFIAKVPDVAVAYRVVERAAHGVLEGALPFVGVGFHGTVGGSVRKIGDVTGINEYADHYGDLFLGHEVIDDIERRIVAVAVGVPAAALEDQEAGRRVFVVLSGNVEPVVGLHAVVDLAGVGDLRRKRSGGNAGLQIGEWAESGEVQTATELFSIEQVVEGV